MRLHQTKVTEKFLQALITCRCQGFFSFSSTFLRSNFICVISILQKIHTFIYRMTLGKSDTENTGKSLEPALSVIVQTRTMIHPCVDPPLCDNCTRLELSFFDPLCPDCREILMNPGTTVPEIFAILRQWTPQTQQSVELIVDEVRQKSP